MLSIDRFAFGCSVVLTVVLAALALQSAPIAVKHHRHHEWGRTTIPPCHRASRPPTADALYREADFAGAAALETDPARKASYIELDVTWTWGMAPATPPVDAYHALLDARAADLALGGAWIPVIELRLGDLAARAATTYMARGDYPQAKRAVETAVAFHTTHAATVEAIRTALHEHGF